MSSLQTLEEKPSSPEATPVRGRPFALRASWVAGVTVFVASSLYLSYFAYRGWIPHDEGLLAQSAERVLAGELPHRDFDESYTGGLTYLHSLSFVIGGTRLTTIRSTLVIFVLCYIIGVYLIALRCAPPWLSAVTTFACVVWSFPNYFAALPSWHVLVLWIFGTLALMKYADTDCKRWLWLAGLCGGLAVIIKITGLYYIAVALLFLAYREQLMSRKNVHSASQRPSYGFAVLMSLDSLVLVGLVVLLLSRHLAVMEVVIFILPCAAVCLTLAIGEWRDGTGTLRGRSWPLAVDVGVLLAGILPPVLLFVAPYAFRGALGDLAYGVLVQPRLRFVFEREPLQPVQTLLPIVFPALLLAVWGLRRPWFGERTLQVVFAAALLLGLSVLMFRDPRLWFYWNFFSVRNLVPIVICLICALLLWAGKDCIAPARRRDLFLLAAGASFGGLIQYPFSVLIYFCYFAPLLVLAIHNLLAVRPQCPQWFRVAFMGLLVAVGVHVNTRYCIEFPSLTSEFTELLDLERGKLLVHEAHQRQYEAVIAMVRRCATEDAAIFATPDCPEIYFLADRRNPTRTMFDFFDDQTGRDARLLEMIDELQILVVVVNLRPLFSHEITTEFAAALQERFPVRRRFGSLVVCARGPAAEQLEAEAGEEEPHDAAEIWTPDSEFYYTWHTPPDAYHAGT